jgi:hypothetical protein
MFPSFLTPSLGSYRVPTSFNKRKLSLEQEEAKSGSAKEKLPLERSEKSYTPRIPKAYRNAGRIRFLLTPLLKSTSDSFEMTPFLFGDGF